MQRGIIIFCWGMGISFLGALPLGTLNVTTTHLAVSEGVATACYFALGAMLAEVIIVRIALVSIGWLNQNPLFLQLFEGITIALLLALSIASFWAAFQHSGIGAPIHINPQSAFFLGVTLSTLNPLHIPFWLGWSTILVNKKILLPQAFDWNIYVIGIGAGTLIGLGVFIIGGIVFITKINQYQYLINFAIGIALLLTAFLQAYKMYQKRRVRK